MLPYQGDELFSFLFHPGVEPIPKKRHNYAGHPAFLRAQRFYFPKGDSCLSIEHVGRYGTALFERVCEMDLEGIVAKHSFGNYVTERERTTWFKIKNRGYSQSVGREKLFERERHREPVPGWHSCELACE